MHSVAVWSSLALLFSLLGSLLILVFRDWSKKHLHRILAFGSGIMLSVAFLHLLPESVDHSPHAAGIAALFAIILIFTAECFTMMHSCAEFAEDCHVHIVGWTAFGSLTLHSLIDGMAIAIAFGQHPWLGTSVAVAILMHKFNDGLTLSGLLTESHFSTKKAFLISAGMALATPAGALVMMPLTSGVSETMMGALLGFIAGSFIYIGSSHILPRIHKERDVSCLLLLILGAILGGIHWC